MQQQKVARAEALGFAPVHFLSFPAMLEGGSIAYRRHGADDDTRRGYLERTYALGREF